MTRLLAESLPPRVHASSRLSVSDWQREGAAQLAAAGIEPGEADIEAEVLLRHVLGWDRAAYLARRREPLPDAAAPRLAALLERRLRREPLAYITGSRAFYGLDFVINCHVLVPRPETEGLVERVIALADGQPRGAAPTIADVGTGSGCIAVTLAVSLDAWRVLAVDSSREALLVARENARRHGVEQRITFVEGDLLEQVTDSVDIIVSNPPYIASAEIAHLQPEIARYEPSTALDGGPDGLAVIRRLLAQAPAHLKPGGAVMLEIGAGQGKAVARLSRAAFAGAHITVENDLAGWERYVTIAARVAGQGASRARSR